MLNLPQLAHSVLNHNRVVVKLLLDPGQLAVRVMFARAERPLRFYRPTIDASLDAAAVGAPVDVHGIVDVWLSSLVLLLLWRE